MNKPTTIRLALASAVALSLGACQSLKSAKTPEAPSQAQGPVTTLQQAIGGKPALIPVGAPVVAQTPTPEPTASAYAPTSAPAAVTAAAAATQPSPAIAGAEAQVRQPAQVIPAQAQVAEAVPTTSVQTGPVKTLVDALRGGGPAPRGALVPQGQAAGSLPPSPAAAPAQQQASAPAQAVERPPYDGRVSVQGPQMQTYTISPSMPDPRIREALRVQGASAGGEGRPPSDADIQHLF